MALLVFASTSNRKTLAGGRILMFDQFLAQILGEVGKKTIAERAVPEQFALLRTLQFVTHFKETAIDVWTSIQTTSCNTGSELVLFDGQGHVGEAVVESVTRRSVVCRVLRSFTSQRPWAGGLTVAVSPPKGDRLRWMIEKLTELGVQRICLLRCSRTVAEPGETKLDKLRGTAAAACKQSRQAWLPELEPFAELRVLVERTKSSGELLYFAHPPDELSAGSIPESSGTQYGALSASSGVSRSECGRKLLLIGPEGGFTDEERGTAINAGGQLIHWPHSILRTETAAIVFSAILLQG